MVITKLSREFGRHGALFRNVEDYCRNASTLFRTLPEAVCVNYLVLREEGEAFHVQQVGEAKASMACNVQGVGDRRPSEHIYFHGVECQMWWEGQSCYCFRWQLMQVLGASGDIHASIYFYIHLSTTRHLTPHNRLKTRRF